MAEAIFPYDFFISRRHSAAAAALEIAKVLEGAGYRARIQDFDLPSSGDGIKMYEVPNECRHFIALLTDDYAAPFTTAEWAAFFTTMAISDERRFIVIRLDDIQPPGLMAPFVYGDLVGVTDPNQRAEIIMRAATGHPLGTRTHRGSQVFGGVPPRNPDFAGREAFLEELHRILNATHRPTAIARAAIHGLGGVGKTSLAAEYAYRHRNDYGGVWWAPGGTRKVLSSSLAELAELIDPKLSDGANVENSAKAALGDDRREPAPVASNLRQRC